MRLASSLSTRRRITASLITRARATTRLHLARRPPASVVMAAVAKTTSPRDASNDAPDNDNNETDDAADNDEIDAAPPHPYVHGRRQVVTAFVLDPQGRALVVRRSDRVRDYRGCWGGVSGGVDHGDASLLARALTEVEEEAGLPRASLALVRRGRPLAVDDEGQRFMVHPFLFRWVGGGDGGKDASAPFSSSLSPPPPPPPPPPPVALNWENTEHAFVPPPGLRALSPRVPLLVETLERLLPLSEDAREGPDAIVGDRCSADAAD